MVTLHSVVLFLNTLEFGSKLLSFKMTGTETCSQATYPISRLPLFQKVTFIDSIAIASNFMVAKCDCAV